jgi:hypothetical protein
VIKKTDGYHDRPTLHEVDRLVVGFASGKPLAEFFSTSTFSLNGPYEGRSGKRGK